MEKCLLWDPDPSPSSPSRTYAFTSVATGKLPKKLGPRVEVNQRGLRVLQRRGQLFYLAHTDKLCTRSHDVDVRAYQITFLFLTAER